MESIDKLRDWCGETCGTSFCGDNINVIADEIEQEIAERYLELPLDVDGVAIEVGDKCCSTVTGEEFSVTSLERTNVGWWVWYEPSKNLAVEYVAHVKPRTIEDVLCEMVVDARDDLQRDFSVAEYAAEIRELLGVVE